MPPASLTASDLHKLGNTFRSNSVSLGHIPAYRILQNQLKGTGEQITDVLDLDSQRQLAAALSCEGELAGLVRRLKESRWQLDAEHIIHDLEPSAFFSLGFCRSLARLAQGSCPTGLGWDEVRAALIDARDKRRSNPDKQARVSKKKHWTQWDTKKALEQLEGTTEPECGTESAVHPQEECPRCAGVPLALTLLTYSISCTVGMSHSDPVITGSTARSVTGIMASHKRVSQASPKSWLQVLQHQASFSRPRPARCKADHERSSEYSRVPIAVERPPGI